MPRPVKAWERAAGLGGVRVGGAGHEAETLGTDKNKEYKSRVGLSNPNSYGDVKNYFFLT